MKPVKADKNMTRYLRKKIRETGMDEAELVDFLIPIHIACSLTRSDKGMSISSALLVAILSELSPKIDDERMEKVSEMSATYSKWIGTFLSNMEDALRTSEQNLEPEAEKEYLN